MKHEMMTPCDNCPFRSDLPNGYLHSERIREIAENLFRGHPFPCHKTTEYEEDDDGSGDMHATAASEQCAGAEIFLVKQGMSTQLGRIAERLGLAATLDMESPVCGSVREMLAVHGHGPGPDGDDEEPEPCSIVNPGCEAPAGMLVGGGVIEGTESAEYECYGCGVPVCGNCSQERDGHRLCDDCLESEDED